MKKLHEQKPFSVLNAAQEHIRVLLEQAEEKYAEYPQYSHRYIQLARKIAMKFKIKLTSQQKRKFCRHCSHFLMPGKNARIRADKGKIVILCLDCKTITRIPYK